MNSTLTSLVKNIFDRTAATKRVSALTGGLKNVDSIIITNSGGGYTTAPAVSFTGGGGSGASAVATIANGVIVSVTITEPGAGYTGTPTVGFVGGGGSGATATAIMSPTTLDAIATTGILPGELLAVISISQTISIYQLVAGTDAESAPDVIRPDDYNGTANAKVWQLQGLYVNALTMLDGANVVCGTGTGTKIGTAANQKLALFGNAPVVQPVGADQGAVTLGNTDNAIGRLTFSDPPTQIEVEALRDACETLADDVRAISALVHALRTAGISLGVWKGEK